MASDFDCNLILANDLFMGIWNKTNNAGVPAVLGEPLRGPIIDCVLEAYEGGFVSGLTILEESGGCDWYIADASEIGMMQSCFD